MINEQNTLDNNCRSLNYKIIYTVHRQNSILSGKYKWKVSRVLDK